MDRASTCFELRIERLPVPLFRQLAARGLSAEELQLVRGGLQLSRRIYASRVDFDGGPFMCHGIGTASITAQLGLPVPYVAFALVHNAYGNGDFGDDASQPTAESRRSLVRSSIGSEAESLVFERFSSPIWALPVPDDPSSRTARRMLVEYADLIEKWENGRIWAASTSREDHRYVAANRDALVARAEGLAGPGFARCVADALWRADDLPEAARTGFLYSRVQLPASATNGSGHSEPRS